MAADPAKGGPPPSTLAAQLVENIAASTKASRTDENSELKGFYDIIQRVTNNADLLKSPSEHIEHNHMLIYVYCRVILDGMKLDDPFLDRAHLRAESLKAIVFMRYAIKETPSVLEYKSDDSGFIFRGHEPLWIWLLPQLLRMLGHPKCLELESSIEGFFQYVLLVVARTGTIWKLASPITLYFRATLTGIPPFHALRVIPTASDTLNSSP